MESDRLRWNRKLAQARSPGQPSALVVRFCSLAPGPIALDLAAGTGNNARYLAEQGFSVLAVDLADKAVASLQDLQLPSLLPIQADLDDFRPRRSSVQLLINCRFLDRRLLPFLSEALAPGGVLIFETQVESDDPDVSLPRTAEYVLRRNELLRSFLNLHILHYEERIQEEDKGAGRVSLASLVARKHE
jgi:SAM-dependent methyltransferase